MIKKNTLHRRMAIAALMMALTGTSALTVERAENMMIQQPEQRPTQTQTLLTDIQRALGTLATRVEPHQGRKSVIMVGSTGEGKSTLATLLGGGQLTAERNPSLVLSGTLNNNQITIGHGNTPGTLIPGAHYVQAKNTVVWDSPGFDCVSGDVADIVNAVSMRYLMDRLGEVKVVLVLSEDALRSFRGREAVKVVNRLTSMFSNNTQLKSMTSLVITKQRALSDDLMVDLKSCADTNTDLSLDGKAFLLYLHERRSERITYVKAPTTEGLYVVDPDNMWTKIRNAAYVTRPTANIVVPLSSREHLRHLSGEINKNIIETLLNSSPSMVGAFKQSNTALANNPDQLRQHLTNCINEITALGQILPGADIDAIKSFSRIPGLSQETKASLISLMDQMRTLKGISKGVDSIKFDTAEWFKALKDTTIPWMKDIKNAEITRLDKEAAQALATQKEQARLAAVALVAQREQERNQARNDLNASRDLVAQREQALNQARIDLATKTAQYNAKTNEIQTLRRNQQTEIQRLQEAHDQRIDDKDRLIEALTQRAESAQATADDLNNKIVRKNGDNQNLRVELDAILTERDALAGHAENLQNEINGLTGQVSQLESSLTATRIKGGKTKVDLVEYWKNKGWHAYKWTSNKKGYPTIQEIAAAWGVTVDELLN